jgi:large subunit ribosomal protein L19|uniref:Ribosomal protein L19 n=1 Tax=Emiliania huxleyi TaxID=2903 RepID=Q4G3E5_EMIHU|nr:ribosomal protein L19 [Gephyrocapsa oceanica]YP_010393597.1 ribosomal protein L19 [Gephyrocapsa ericsonii]YP_010393707.1 ribosomal protein L19 [Gephyrocapsa parvula]YP_277322.1 ribosomal protein L19 [Emiliania huxleyi]AAX13821.1 ribosomal protein L19 [Emiliania huxleyi]AEI29486.1 ribosomal protein L19 [Emiliania huxleyi]UPY82386.1 ribosomal protein L19 [Emiliania huxleyi]UPY82716.1 ribosomal protein L19 [Emiliania huxleyi]UPY82826.1 ribosomal protein L19 [Emiliania huxleyi]
MSVLEKIVKESDFFYKKENLPKFRVGDTVKVTLYLELPKADEAKKGKERIQVYQGVIISTHNNENPTNATITVRKMFQGGGIEKVFLLNSPWLKTVEVLTSAKVRRGKLYYLRDRVGKSARLKRLFT